MVPMAAFLEQEESDSMFCRKHSFVPSYPRSWKHEAFVRASGSSWQPSSSSGWALGLAPAI